MDRNLEVEVHMPEKEDKTMVEKGAPVESAAHVAAKKQKMEQRALVTSSALEKEHWVAELESLAEALSQSEVTQEATHALV
jgi:hypothetical protein